MTTVPTSARRPFPRMDGERRRLWLLVGFAVLVSRLIVWEAGIVAARAFGSVTLPSGYAPAFERAGTGFGGLIQYPVIRWDGAWYLTIAGHGYAIAGAPYPPIRANFFPLYPLLVAALHVVGLPLELGAFVISVACLTVAVVGLARLVELEVGPGHRWASGDARTLTVVALVVSPVSFYFSAAYSESLFLALSVGVFLFGRQGRWGRAATCAALAGATRGPGILLLIPLVWLYLYGPRADRPPDRPDARWRPRYRLQGEAAWLWLAPAGLGAYILFLELSGTGAFAFVATQRDLWQHFLAAPWTTVWHGGRLAWHDIRTIADGSQHLSLFGTYPGASLDNGWENVLPFAALLLAVPALVGVWRRLPAAYGLYVSAAVLLDLVSPVTYQPLQSLPRYLVVLFPLTMSFGGWLARHPRLRYPALGCSVASLALLSGEFVTWHFVG